MTICDFCFKTYFDDDRWLRGRSKAYHRSCTSWAESVQYPCTVCVTLLEVTRKVHEQPQKLFDDDNASSMGQKSYSEVLLEWLGTNKHILEPSLPLYQVQMQEGGARHEWLLRFVATNRTGEGPVLPTQKFVVYGSYYDREDGKDDRPPRIGNSTASDATFEQLTQWLDSCEQTHTQCGHLHDESRKRYGNFMPTRVIDVKDKRLLETKPHNIRAPYMTLSHCWGGEPKGQLTRDTHAAYLKSLPYDDLPLTFQHAITITDRLGIRYLWIDSLCIVQKEPEPKPDWVAEAPSMAKVYGNSFCNIAAVSSYNSTQGIFRPRRIAGLPPSLARVRWSGQNLMCRVVRDEFWTDELLGEPLYTRGWVFQERMLSPRILHFHKKQVFWQCLSLTACESLPGGLSKVVDDERRDELRWRQILHKERGLTASGGREVPQWMERADLNAIWRVAVRSYTSCNLTVKTDKLIALASIASAMQDLLGEEYVAGMWGQDTLLVDQLRWKVENWYVRKSWEKEPTNEYRAPSWSWASLDGVVKVPARIKHEFNQYTLKMENDGLQLVLKIPGVPTGPLVSGRLEVRSKLFRATFNAPSVESKTWTWLRLAEHDEDGTKEFCELTLDRSISQVGGTDAADDIKLSFLGDGNGAKLECCVLLLVYELVPNEGLRNGSALALRPANEVRTFTRIGLVEFRGFLTSPEDAFTSPEQKNIMDKDERRLITLV